MKVKKCEKKKLVAFRLEESKIDKLKKVAKKNKLTIVGVLRQLIDQLES